MAAVAVMALAVCIAAGDARAAEDSIDEIVVSATRRTARTADIPIPVSRVGSDTLGARKLVTDALAGNPGVSVQQTTPGQGAAIIRGLKGSSILHIVDGLRLNNAIFRSAPTQYFALVPGSALDHVEVLRGTPASLYGSDAIGGVVQAITRVPTMDSATTTIRGEARAALDTAALERRIGATLDIGNQRSAASISLEYQKNGNRRIGGGERVGPSGYVAKGGRIALSLTPDAPRSWFFDLHFLEQPATPRVDELVAGFGQSEPSAAEFVFAPNRRVFAHARYRDRDGPLGLDWRTSIAWQRIEDDRRTRELNSPLRQNEDNRSDLAGALVTAAHPGERHAWIVGAEVYVDRVASRRFAQDIAGGAPQPLASRFPDGSEVTQAAVFINGERTAGRRQSLLAGLRLSSVRVRLPGTAVSAAASIDTTDVSGDIGWLYRLGGDWQLVANAGFGFRAPNVFDLGTLGNRPGNRFNIPNTDLASENVTQLDLGLRRYADRWRLELMLYALRYDDRITTVLTGDVTPDGRDVSQSANAAHSTIRGAEFGARVQISSRLAGFASLNYTWGKDTANGIDTPADRAPPLHGRAGVEFSSNDALRWDAWIDFAGEQDRLSPRDLSDPRIDPQGTPGWASLGARAEWRVNAAWQLTFAIENLLDKRYRVHGSGIDAPGRNLLLRMRWAFR